MVWSRQQISGVIKGMIILLTLCVTMPRIAAKNRLTAVDSLWRTANDKMEAGRPHEALTDLFDILERADAAPRTVPDSTVASTLLLTGNIYLGFSDYVNSAHYYERAIEATSNPDIQLKAIYNLSVNYALLGEDRKARATNARIRQLKVRDTLLCRYDQLISKAFIEKTFGYADRSATLFHKGLTIAERMGARGTSYRFTPLSELAEYYEKQDIRDSALIYYYQYEDLAIRLKVPQMIADSQRGLMRLYIKNGDRQKALDYANRHIATMDSMVDMARFIHISADRERKRENADSKRIQDLQFTISKQKALLYTLVIALAIAATIFIFARTLLNRTRQLFARNREIAILQDIRINTAEPGRPATGESIREYGAETDYDADQRGLMDKIRKELSRPENFCDPSYSITALASAIGSNTHYVSEAINATTGDNFRALLNRYRIDEGRRRLTSDPAYQSLTIKSIGESVGFKSASNFVIAFKKITGMTPSLYQKMAKEKSSKTAES